MPIPTFGISTSPVLSLSALLNIDARSGEEEPASLLSSGGGYVTDGEGFFGLGFSFGFG